MSNEEVVSAVVCFFIFISLLFAKVPNEIGYHGRLKSYNQPYNGNRLSIKYMILAKQEHLYGNQEIKMLVFQAVFFHM
ncbi:MAG: hypothetical protein LBS81_02040 [Endomicrobium sp.]|jgi:hypothetical protein|nr:hypothetical protein [Endomicrobium sp.]